MTNMQERQKQLKQEVSHFHVKTEDKLSPPRDSLELSTLSIVVVVTFQKCRCQYCRALLTYAGGQVAGWSPGYCRYH